MPLRKSAQTALLSLCLLSAARAADTNALINRLIQTGHSSWIGSPDLQPWHLKLEVQLFDDKAQPTEQGTIEEWWTSPAAYQITYTFPSYTASLVHSGNVYSRTKDTDSPPFLLHLLLRQVVAPMAPDKEISQSTPVLRNLTVEKLPLECVMIARKVDDTSEPPLGLFPTYCFGPGTNSLRMIYDFGSQAVIRNTMGVFQKREVALDLTVLDNGKKKATAHLSTLESNSTLIPPAIDPESIEKEESATPVSGSVMAGHKVSGELPVVHYRGVVVMNATIGRDGHVRSLRLVTVSNSQLALAAVVAVRSWIYTPWLLNGKPVEVTTPITFNFVETPMPR
jgi:Gram-negative bacterial TonB protein C-terminal